MPGNSILEGWFSYTKTTPIKTLENQIRLVKEEGHWLVYVPLVLPDTMTPGNVTASLSKADKE